MLGPEWRWPRKCNRNLLHGQREKYLVIKNHVGLPFPYVKKMYSLYIEAHEYLF
jgi:hypothetical protein